MGMFDRLYDHDGNEWQTKAFGCLLDNYRIGEPIGTPASYQVEVLGDRKEGGSIDSYATVRNGILTSIPDSRDKSLPLLDYDGCYLTQPTQEGA